MLPSIGKVLAQKLRQAGIAGYEDLAELSSAKVQLRIWDRVCVTGYSVLHALEGGIQGMRSATCPQAKTSSENRATGCAGLWIAHGATHLPCTIGVTDAAGMGPFSGPSGT